MTRNIDTGGLFQFYTGRLEQSQVMLIEYTLKEKVDPVKLQAALKKAIAVFSVYRVKLILNEKRQPVYAENELAPIVYVNDGRPHMFGEKSRGYLFRVSYSVRTVSLSVHHMLTDFFGANEFLKYILRFYLHQTDESISVSTDTLAVDPNDTRDPYTLFGDIEAVGYNMADKWKNELVIPNKMQYRRGASYPVRSIVFPLERLLQAAKKTDASAFPVLFWLMAKAAATTYDAEDKNIVGAGAVNYRGLYNSRTPLCFSRSFRMILLSREHSMGLENQFTIQRFRMDLKLDRATTDQDIVLRMESAKRKSGPIEDYVMNQDLLDAKRKEGEKKSAFYFTYPGRMDLPDDMAQYVDSFWFNSPTTRGPVRATAYSWKDSLIYNLTEFACEKSIIPEMVHLLKKFGVESTVTDSSERYYDYYPMEELIYMNQ